MISSRSTRVQVELGFLEVFVVELIIEMDNRGEVTQILSGITFDRNNIF